MTYYLKIALISLLVGIVVGILLPKKQSEWLSNVMIASPYREPTIIEKTTP